MKKSSGAGSQGNFIAFFFFFFFAIFTQEEIISKAHWYFLASYLPLASPKRGWKNSLIAGYRVWWAWEEPRSS